MLQRIKSIEQELRRLYPLQLTKEKLSKLVNCRDQLHSLHRKRNSAKTMHALEEALTVAFVPSAFFPSQRQIDYIKLVVGDRLLLDIGMDVPRKSGATAATLEKLADIKVVVSNPVVMQPDKYHEVQEKTGLAVIEAHKNQSCVLALFNPPQDQDASLQTVSKYYSYKGDVVLVSGQRQRTATPAFWTFMDQHFTLAHTVNALTVYPFVERSKWAIDTPLHIYVRLN